MKVLAAAAVGLALAAPAGALRTPDATPAELLDGAAVVIPYRIRPRESPQRLALRVLGVAPSGARISYLQLYLDGNALCAAHADVACYPSSLGRLWYARLVTRSAARIPPPEQAAVLERASTVVAVDGGRLLRRP